MWGTQWQLEPFCLLPPESAEAAAVIAAGCRDPFGFVPNRVAVSVPVTLGTQASLPFYDLPGADVMVGDVTSRVAYGSLVVYDDRDGNGSLDLARPGRTASGGDEGRGDDSIDSTDVVYGASFWTMTAPDQRVAFREGAFNARSAFYPRSGCGDPPPQFSILAAGGFSALDGLTSAAAGRLPSQDPARCSELPPAADRRPHRGAGSGDRVRGGLHPAPGGQQHPLSPAAGAGPRSIGTGERVRAPALVRYERTVQR